jgi:hypothetical protein
VRRLVHPQYTVESTDNPHAELALRAVALAFDQSQNRSERLLPKGSKIYATISRLRRDEDLPPHITKKLRNQFLELPWMEMSHLVGMSREIPDQFLIDGDKINASPFFS